MGFFQNMWDKVSDFGDSVKESVSSFSEKVENLLKKDPDDVALDIKKKSYDMAINPSEGTSNKTQERTKEAVGLFGVTWDVGTGMKGFWDKLFDTDSDKNNTGPDM